MNSIYIITGASQGIGKGLALKALKTGGQVIGISRSHTIEHENYVGIETDLSNTEATINLANSLFTDLQTYDRVVLINNAGTLGDVGHLGAIASDAIPHLMNLNVSTPMILMNAFLQELKSFVGEKVIFNISSGAGKRAVDGWSGYCASKAALDMATKVAFEENKLDNNHFEIRAIAPGVVDTAMQTEIRSADHDSFSGVEKFRQLKANNELSDENEVAEKYFEILNNLDRYNEPILDVRHI